MDSTSPTRRLADTLLPNGLDAYVTEKRLDGMSWRRISLALRDEIQVDVSERTLQTWFRESPATASA